jgi:hypothetical protein
MMMRRRKRRRRTSFAKFDRKLHTKKMDGDSYLKIQMRANVAGLATEFE